MLCQDADCNARSLSSRRQRASCTQSERGKEGGCWAGRYIVVKAQESLGRVGGHVGRYYIVRARYHGAVLKYLDFWRGRGEGSYSVFVPRHTVAGELVRQDLRCGHNPLPVIVAGQGWARVSLLA